MSKIIATAAIRGAHKLVGQAEADLQAALKKHGADKNVEFPNTGYFLPVTYGMSGIKVEKVGDLQKVVDESKSLLPPLPDEKLWLPYLGHALDAGMATLFADEVIEVLKYLNDPVPYTMTVNSNGSGLWLGAANDVIMRERGIEFVDGSAPGFAACVGAPEDPDVAVKIAQELQEKNLYVFMSCDSNGRSMAEQLKEKGVQLGWDTRLVPFGKDVTATVFALGFATRAAMAFGGVQPGDFERNLRYNKNRIFAFVLAFGEVSDEKYAQAAGAINYGFPVISDHDIPQILPTGICTYEHVVSQIPHDKMVQKAVEVRGLKIKVTKIPIPVAYGPAFEGERIRREDTEVEIRGDKKVAFEWLTTLEPEKVEDGKIEIIGDDVDKLKRDGANTIVPYGMVVEVAGREMESDFEPIIERQLHHMINYASGAFHMGQRDQIRLRLSKAAVEKGLKLEHLGKIVHAKIHDEFGSIVDKVQVKLITDEKAAEEWRDKARKVFHHRDDRIKGLTDEAVDTFYSCTLCVPKGEEIVLADGSFKPVEEVIEECVDAKENVVLSLNEDRFEPKRVDELFLNPAPQKLTELTLTNNQTVTVTPNHKLLVDKEDGLDWVKAAHIKPDDRLVSPKKSVVNISNAKRYIVDYLPENLRIFDNDFYSYLREKILVKYGNLAKASRKLNIPYRQLYYALYFKDTVYRLGRRRFTLQEIREIITKLKLNWDNEKKKLETFGTNRGYKILKKTLDNDLLYLAGLIASDGCVVRRQKGCFVQFTNNEKSLIDIFNRISSQLFETTPKVFEVKPSISRSEKITIHAKNTTYVSHINNSAIGPLIRGLGIGQDTDRKKKWTGHTISTLPPKMVAAFIRGVFDGDGHVTAARAIITTKSKKEAKHLILLFKKLGIATYQSKITRGYQVATRGGSDFINFKKLISSNHPKKKEKLDKAVVAFDGNHVVRTDTVPLFCNMVIGELLDEIVINKSKLSIDRKTLENWEKKKNPISKEKLKLFLKDIESNVNGSLHYKELSKWANSNLVFEKVKSKKEITYNHREVYNFSVQDTHNYLINGVVAKNCQSFAPTHVCVVTPERPGLCGAVNWLDGKAGYQIDPSGGHQPIPKGNTVDEKVGQWDKANEYIKQASRGVIERMSAYSMITDPMSSCGCFECIACILPVTNGIMIVDRDFADMTPCGMKFSTLAGTVGGGVQTPGFIGHSKLYVISNKFISADGGIKRIVWMPKQLKEELAADFTKRAEAEGVADLIDKIADETVAQTEEEVLKYITEKGHPALSMDPML